MASLNSVGPGDAIEFVHLKRLIDVTDGNLGAHLATLEKAGYVAQEKDFVGRKPRTRIRITVQGRRAFEDHLAFLRSLLNDAGIASAPNT
jgi:DNA-binding MarR family transcriptional regulator